MEVAKDSEKEKNRTDWKGYNSSQKKTFCEQKWERRGKNIRNCRGVKRTEKFQERNARKRDLTNLKRQKKAKQGGGVLRWTQFRKHFDEEEGTIL